MTPLSAAAAPTVAFKTPTNGSTISGNIYQSSACEVTGSNIDRVRFYLDSRTLNTEQNSPWNCNIDTRKFSDGAHTLRAVAYDNKGASASTQISVNIRNSTTNTPPAVSFKAPLNGATVSGWLDGATCEALASDSDGVKQVQFFMDGTTLNTEKLAPYNCAVDTKKFADGTHVLKALATDAAGASSSAQVSLTVKNSATTPTPTEPTTSLPAPSTGTLDAWFKSPLKGATVSGLLQLDKCYVAGRSVSKVDFLLDSTPLNTDSNVADGMSCVLDTTKFANGSHTLKAVAYDSAGKTYLEQISINIQNSTSSPTQPPANVAPTVSITSPAEGAKLSGSAVTFDAAASDSDGSIAKVEFLLGSTLLATDTTNSYHTTIDTTKYANGSYTLVARATDNAGAVSTAQRSVTIDNAVSVPSLPSTGTRAVPTFESIGLYWTPGTNPGSEGCQVQYRKQGTTEWKQGLPMWYDSRNSECRGSLVHLSPATAYEVQFALPGQQPSRALTVSTWSESFPIARTVQLQSGSQQIKITEGGTPSGYVLYTGPATIDVANNADFNITISAPYVIVRGLTLKGARIDGIRMLQGAHDVVIEDNDISGWGRYRTTTSGGWKVGVDRDSAIRADCRATPFLERTVIQRNKLHHPRYGANSWDWGHPLGPQAITYSFCGGNHVMRYNEVFSSDGQYFNDGFSGEDNFSAVGFPNADTDIYGNRISHAWDDAIEAEGGNKNVRIWGNYIDQTATGIASTVVHHGPLYIFRNVYNRSRMYSQRSPDSDDRNSYFKAGQAGGYGGGRRYVLHNTALQATQSGLTYPLGAGAGLKGNSTQPLTNTVSRNNILHVWKSNWQSVAEQSGSTGNDLNYDLYNGVVSAYSGAEANGIKALPVYSPGHGWVNEAGGHYQLAPGTPGYDQGVRLPNFNDGFLGAGPDMGAHEGGSPAMKFGASGGQ